MQLKVTYYVFYSTPLILESHELRLIEVPRAVAENEWRERG